MQVATSNPSFQGNVVSTVDLNEPEGRNWKRIALKSFVALGVVGVAAGVGFVVGQSNSGTSDDDGASALSAVAEAQATLKSAYFDEENPVFTNNLTISEINDLIDMYEAADDWDDQFMTVDIMSALKTLRDEEQGQVRSLRAADEDEGESLRARRLALTSNQQTIGTVAWAEVEAADYSGGLVHENDAVIVFRKADAIYGSAGGTTGQACWVMAQESGDTADWVDNFDTGDETVWSIKNYYHRAEACGCESTTWWWCSQYYACSTSKAHGDGFDGFVKPYNALRYQIWSRIQSTCNSNDRLIIAGYSRGGGVLNALAYTMYKDGLWSTSKMMLVTFGSPRVLSDGLSDEVHGKFEQLRFVNNDDVVPSVPYGWMGYKHFGTNKNRNGNEGRDSPGFSSSISDHTSYGDWF
ncbi:Mono- and diacylglycerol lipase, partial [Hondaea fermentalgiana]